MQQNKQVSLSNLAVARKQVLVLGLPKYYLQSCWGKQNTKNTKEKYYSGLQQLITFKEKIISIIHCLLHRQS